MAIIPTAIIQRGGFMRIIFPALAAVVMTASPLSAAELLTNGNFETGTYAGWTAVAAAGANGNIQLDTPGTTTPIGSFVTAANPAGGRFYSVTDQSGPGAYALLQSFTVAAGTTALTLTFQQFVQTAAQQVVGPANLDFTGAANQHARVDILRAGASAFSTAAADVVTNLYIGIDGNFGTPYVNRSYNLSALAPGTYQLRFAQVDNQGNFNQGVDNVSLNATVNGAVPEPGTWAFMIVGFGAIGGALRRRPTMISLTS